MNYLLLPGLLLKFFSNRFIVPLGRLSYSVFLVNLTVMMISQSRMRSPNYLSKGTVVRLKLLFEYLYNIINVLKLLISFTIVHLSYFLLILTNSIMYTLIIL